MTFPSITSMIRNGNKAAVAVVADFVERVPDEWAAEPATTG